MECIDGDGASNPHTHTHAHSGLAVTASADGACRVFGASMSIGVDSATNSSPGEAYSMDEVT